MIENLNRTKLYIPATRPDLVLRPRLIKCLDEGLHEQIKLTLISGKAGAGKTTIASEWVKHVSMPTVWISLDEQDNHLNRFFNYFLAAFQQIGIKISPTLLGQLENGQSDWVNSLFMDLLHSDNLKLSPCVLILDDYHLINNERIHQALSFLIENIPPQIHLVCLTRIDPPWSLPRFRARNQICEIRDSDLEFTTNEALQFFRNALNLDLPDEEITAINNYAEGWISGLQLAAISFNNLQKNDERVEFINLFNNKNRFISDYLLEEVFNQQSPEIQEFLLITSLLEQMCADLCDVVRNSNRENIPAAIEYHNSQEILESLLKKNLFVVALDNERKWYRFHHLFAGFLESLRSRRFSKEQIRNFHQNASIWHEKEGIIEEAVRHAIAAESFDQAANMIEENIANLYSQSKVPILLDWIEKLPDEINKNHPWIEIHHANTMAISGQPEKAEQIINNIELRIQQNTTQESELRGHIAAIRAYISNLKGDAKVAISLSELAEDLLSDNYPTGRALALFTLADTRFAYDEIAKSRQALLKMIELGKRSNQVLILVQALCELAKVKRLEGNLQHAKSLLDQAYEYLCDQDYLNSRLRCPYEFEMSELLREWNKLDAAHKHAEIGDECRKRWGGYLLVGDLVLMRVLFACGDTHAAMEALHTAEQIVNTYQFQMGLTIEYKTSRVIQYLAIGDVDAASRSAINCIGETELEKIALARLNLAQDNINQALKILEDCKEHAEKSRHTGRLIQILCLMAIAHRHKNEINLSIENLLHALSIARPEGFMRTFLDLGEEIEELLKQIYLTYRSQSNLSEKDRLLNDYTFDLLAAFNQEKNKYSKRDNQGKYIFLTEREIEVLNFLSEGLTNKAIADRLIVAPSTIKQHLKNMYVKLDVHNRTQAVARGRELGLISE